MTALLQVLSLFLLMLCGLGAMRFRLLDDKGLKGLNTLVLWFAQPAMIAFKLQQDADAQLIADLAWVFVLTLLHARTIAEFEQEFRSQIAAVTGDDSTCVISFYGWKDMTHIRTSLKRRYEYISSVIGQLNAIHDDRAALESALVAHWQIYRKDTLAYERQEG